MDFRKHDKRPLDLEVASCALGAAFKHLPEIQLHVLSAPLVMSTRRTNSSVLWRIVSGLVSYFNDSFVGGLFLSDMLDLYRRVKLVVSRERVSVCVVIAWVIDITLPSTYSASPSFPVLHHNGDPSVSIKDCPQCGGFYMLLTTPNTKKVHPSVAK